MGSSSWEPAHLPPGVRMRNLPQRDDDRGSLVELTSTALGDDAQPAQWNVLRSTANTLRGMHVHVRHTDWITVVEGVAVFGLVDLRPEAIAAGTRATVRMDATSPQVLTIPPGVLHGIYTPDASVVLNGLSHEFDPADDLAVRFDDPELMLDWNVVDPVLSPHDRAAPTIAGLFDRLATEGVALPTLEA